MLPNLIYTILGVFVSYRTNEIFFHTISLSLIVTSDINMEDLFCSALVVADCKHKRRKDYKFSWENALSHNGDTGVRLQYLHARWATLG